ncbi:hypothetical protein Desaci_1640 [Desulfosporosinus acidiphilus SJ4]|uniref:Uncharacterized protein n=1 Tax=Desulfosporosinus acidiphilus (strain DSM 22704 / JCM 16185 / SJ4) TaxID=646529 RepID=I4D4B5_DESAJ|nr:hypothetical protein [Desulfosporosinus acidiphilus]AFM40639.1 hypothetical protein Desaci_1640 [Desulfosporosinus acidiphilus SJ4]
MEERVEEIKPISRIRAVRKLALRDPKRGRRELMYQFNRYHKTKRKKVTNTKSNKKPENQMNYKVSTDDISEEIKDVMNRLAFDRAMILGDQS